MARLFLGFLCIIFLNTWAGDEFSRPRAQPASAQSRGAALARQVEDRDVGRDARMSLRMKLFDRRGRVRERALSILSLRGGPGRPVDGDQTLIRFTYPNDIAGTGFLVWDHPDAADERFLFLPSLGRTRRIAANEAQESFVGSDFTYEEFGGREFDDYTYALIEDAGSPTTWRDAAGRTSRVQRLESVSRDPNARFPRIVSLVHTESLVIVAGEIYNRRKQVQKRFLVKRLERVGGYWTALEMEMTDEVEGTRTELAFETVEYNVGLSPDAFTRRELERGRLP